MTGLIPIYKSKWQENVVPLCIYSFVQVQWPLGHLEILRISANFFTWKT
jgi:hypothetical protein